MNIAEIGNVDVRLLACACQTPIPVPHGVAPDRAGESFALRPQFFSLYVHRKGSGLGLPDGHKL